MAINNQQTIQAMSNILQIIGQAKQLQQQRSILDSAGAGQPNPLAPYLDINQQAGQGKGMLRPQQPVNNPQSLKKQELLRKIDNEGFDSLTPDEELFLWENMNPGEKTSDSPVPEELKQNTDPLNLGI